MVVLTILLYLIINRIVLMEFISLERVVLVYFSTICVEVNCLMFISLLVVARSSTFAAMHDLGKSFLMPGLGFSI